MTRLFLIMTMALLSSLATLAQNNKKLVVIITRANWCPACRSSENKINNDLIPAYSNSKDVTIVVNDITNKKSKAKSKPVLAAAGVYEQSLKEQASGSIALINLATGRVIDRLYVVYETEKIKKAISEALAGI